MPFIHIELVEGRSLEARQAMAHEVIDVVAKHTGAPVEHIHVIINEMRKEDYVHLEAAKDSAAN
ncbi:2-hydroxymuconate tautomerase [Vaginisenegalia massiliensis]|uniref:2-hydroxymuconate tautomerase n=1 Tax=Vaginisenegalia massiliensis TaxID=2058294 RepID=UPI000F539FD7|nr:2-hydroxymuconate tautomerase [Vaginisenegalia massiliensis]